MQYPCFFRLLTQAGDAGAGKAPAVLPRTYSGAEWLSGDGWAVLGCAVWWPVQRPAQAHTQSCLLAAAETGPTCSSWRCCRAAAPCLRSRQCSRTGSRPRRTCRRAPGIYPSKRTAGRRKGQRIRICAQRVKREHSFAPSAVHAETSEAHILSASSGENMPRDSPVVDTAMVRICHSHPSCPSPAGLCSPSSGPRLPLGPGTAALTLHVWQRPPSNSG